MFYQITLSKVTDILSRTEH